MLARYMDESRSIPTATSFRTVTVTAMDGRRKQLKAGGQKVSFTHLIAYAIARAATEDMPVMAHHFAETDGKPTSVDDHAVNLGIAVDVEKKDGTRTLMVPVIRDAARLSFADFLAAYNGLIEKARTNALSADDLVGANISLTNPGGLGTVGSVPRLMVGQGTIVAAGSIAYPVGLGNVGELIGAEKVMTMTSTYDHRIIQGAESGRFLGRIEALLDGEEGFYEDVFSSAGRGGRTRASATEATARTGRSPRRPTPNARAPPSEELLQAVQAATSLLKAHRTHGHLAAKLDPLGLNDAGGDPALDPEPLSLTPELMRQIPAHILRMYVPGDTLEDALPRLREVYCGPIAYEIEHISSHRQRVWLREKIESSAFRQPLAADRKRWLLRRLIKVDALERFLHKAYLGQKQFSIEGLDMTVPMLDELIQLSGGVGAREVVIGMAHRGRLNVLAHNLGRAYETIFAEFEGAQTLEAVTTIPQGGTGDVKYHHGADGSYELRDGKSILVRLESNPSHLEYVSPVVEGATRAAQTAREGPHARHDTDAALPVVIHGDAAFPAQGVVSETLNLQALDGYSVGGSLHLITNNQVGFTTDTEDARSTRWASDLAKGFDVPIIHVNADAVEACLAAVHLAFAFRQEFGHDVLIDLIGYRRFGHNEADEPALHAARDVPRDQGAQARAGDLRRAAHRRGRREQGRRRGAGRRGVGHAVGPPRRAQGPHRGRGGDRAPHGRVPARPHALARRRDGGAGGAAARAQRGAAAPARGLDRGGFGLQLRHLVGGEARLGLVVGQALLALAQHLEPLVDLVCSAATSASLAARFLSQVRQLALDVDLLALPVCEIPRRRFKAAAASLRCWSTVSIAAVRSFSWLSIAATCCSRSPNTARRWFRPVVSCASLPWTVARSPLAFSVAATLPWRSAAWPFRSAT